MPTLYLLDYYDQHVNRTLGIFDNSPLVNVTMENLRDDDTYYGKFHVREIPVEVLQEDYYCSIKCMSVMGANVCHVDGIFLDEISLPEPRELTRFSYLWRTRFETNRVYELITSMILI